MRIEHGRNGCQGLYTAQGVEMMDGISGKTYGRDERFVMVW